MFMCREDLALNNLQRLICHKNQTNQILVFVMMLIIYCKYDQLFQLKEEIQYSLYFFGISHERYPAICFSITHKMKFHVTTFVFCQSAYVLKKFNFRGI